MRYLVLALAIVLLLRPWLSRQVSGPRPTSPSGVVVISIDRWRRAALVMFIAAALLPFAGMVGLNVSAAVVGWAMALTGIAYIVLGGIQGWIEGRSRSGAA